MSDGNLRAIFQKHLPSAHWQPVESWSTGQGVPDVNFCFPGGIEGWIENKATDGWAVDISPHQIAWLERRARAGGRVFVAVRRVAQAGPRRGPACDELWLAPGAEVRSLKATGLAEGGAFLGFWEGGPAKWHWPTILKLLIRRPL